MKSFCCFFIFFLGIGLLKGQDTKVFEALHKARLYDSILVLSAGKTVTDWNTETPLYIGESLSARARYEEAVPYYERALNSKSKAIRGSAAANLGLHYYMTSQYDQSKSYFNLALKSKKSKKVVEYAVKEMNAFGLSDFYDNWTVEETEHLRLHFQEKIPLNRSKYATGLEDAFVEINAFFGSKFPKKTDVFIWGDLEEAKSLLKTPLGFTRAPYCLTHMYYKQTRGHELVHTISHFYQKPIEKTRFINEGVAVCFDLSKEDRMELARSAVVNNNVEVNLKDMWNRGNQTSPNILYPIAGAFIQILLEKGTKEQLLQLIPNQTYINAKKIYGDNLDIWMSEFEKFLNK
jgi:tetratricopeptide (TPR) repeat protein